MDIQVEPMKRIGMSYRCLEYLSTFGSPLNRHTQPSPLRAPVGWGEVAHGGVLLRLDRLRQEPWYPCKWRFRDAMPQLQILWAVHTYSYSELSNEA